MPVAIDRLGPGTLTFGAGPNDFSMQVSRCVLVPDNQEEEATPTLGEPFPVAEVQTNWTLEGDAISDWAQADGFINWAFDNKNTEQAFEFVPNTGETIMWSGTCRIVAMEIGGDVQAQISTSFSFPVKGQPVRGAFTPLPFKATTSSTASKE